MQRDSGEGAGDDQADAGTKTFEREHEMSLAANSRDLLSQVERALQRLATGPTRSAKAAGTRSARPDCRRSPVQPCACHASSARSGGNRARSRRPSPRFGLVPDCSLAIVGAILAVDIVTKLIAVAKLADRDRVTVIPHVLWLTFTRNAGAAFSLGTGATAVFTAVAVGVVVVIVRTARSLASTGWAVVLGLLLGGALGNLSDRLFRSPGPLRGHVVDWIELPHWPVFNIADSAIVIGGLLAVLLSFRGVELKGTPDNAELEGSGK